MPTSNIVDIDTFSEGNTIKMDVKVMSLCSAVDDTGTHAQRLQLAPTQTSPRMNSPYVRSTPESFRNSDRIKVVFHINQKDFLHSVLRCQINYTMSSCESDRSVTVHLAYVWAQIIGGDASSDYDITSAASASSESLSIISIPFTWTNYSTISVINEAS